MANQSKLIKRGEIFIKEGDKLNSIYLIQSGGVNQCLIKNKRPLDLFQLGPNHILNEGAILGQNPSQTSAIATTDVQYIDVPLEIVKLQVESSTPLVKSIIKSLSERLRSAINDLKSTKTEKESSPLPDDQVAKVFGVIYHTALHRGEKQKDGSLIVDWLLLKQYATRVFSEFPKRLEQALCLLVKLKYCDFVMGKPADDPKGPEELQKVIFRDISTIQDFFEFFQYHYFKNGRTDLLKYDEGSFKIVETLLKVTENIEADRFGIVTVSFTEVLEAFKKILNLALTGDHFVRLEARGIYAKRMNLEKRGVLLQFERREYEKILCSWRILNEIDKWNSKGFVDMNEEEKKVKLSDPMNCPSCKVPYTKNQKFCGECGFKLAA
jgi:CRP-like cAMP-binding protein